MVKKDPYDMTVRMSMIEKAWPPPTPEQAALEQERCRHLLASHNAQDLTPMLGLEAS